MKGFFDGHLCSLRLLEVVFFVKKRFGDDKITSESGKVDIHNILKTLLVPMSINFFCV